jgi:DNA invertase Pin-like site-specific DNA recombinase
MKKNIHHRAKLTNEQVRKMRADYLAYVVGYETLAKRYGCGVSTVRDIVQWRTRVNA